MSGRNRNYGAARSAGRLDRSRDPAILNAALAALTKRI